MRGLFIDVSLEWEKILREYRMCLDLEREINQAPPGLTEYEEWKLAAALAKGIQSIYGGVENLFRLVAKTFEGELPQGDDWHRQLVDRMGYEWPEVRPAVISEETCSTLQELRAFRNVFHRNYGLDLKLHKVLTNFGVTREALIHLREDLLGFAKEQQEVLELKAVPLPGEPDPLIPR